PTLLRLDDGAGGLDGGDDLARVVRVVVHDRDAARDAGDVEAARGPGEGGQAGGQRRRVEVRRGGGDRGQRYQGVEDVVVPGHRQFEAQRTVRGVDLDLGAARSGALGGDPPARVGGGAVGDDGGAGLCGTLAQGAGARVIGADHQGPVGLELAGQGVEGRREGDGIAVEVEVVGL